MVEERDHEYIKHDDEVLSMALPLMNPSKSLFLLHKKKRMRLVTFLLKFLMIPYSMIQRGKKKGNPWTKQILLIMKLKM